MMKSAAAFVATFVVLLVLDLLWIGVVANPMYRAGIGHLMAETADLKWAFVFYIVYVTGLLHYGVAPHASAPGVLATAKSAALFGFFAYAVYDLTNLAVLRDWPVSLAFIDMAWGTTVSTLAAVAGKFAYDKL